MGDQTSRPSGLILAALLLALACREKGAPARGNVERGKALFLTHCAICHGERGDGEGMRRTGLSSKPRNFSDPAWRARTSEQKIFDAIRHGIDRTSMPAFNALDDQQTFDLVAYIQSLSKSPPPPR